MFCLKRNPTFFYIYVVLIGGFLAGCTSPSKDTAVYKKPNILLIVADDLGYADLGCYGGDISTPTIDSLAKAGMRFSRFHTAPLCAPTRAMLLSGNDNHTAGMGIQGKSTTAYGYEGRIMNRVAIIPEVLKQAGYHTYMAGKWHLGNGDSNPKQRGFDRSFVNILGGGNHYNDQGLFSNFPKTPYTEDGEPAEWPDGKYSTDFYTDKLIEYMEDNIDDDQPFFAFAAYTSPHWPLQVDARYIKKYEGRYDDGYEALKARRFESLKATGMIPADAILPPNHEQIIAWDSLSPEQQRKEARKMELYSGMVDNLDVNIGRLLNYLRSKGELENTLIVFMSDNGAAAEDFYYDDVYGPFLKEHFNEDYDNMGNPDSFISYGPQWAEAGSSPFRYFKGQATEGAVIAPMIIAGYNVPSQNTIYHEFATLMDIAPTFYELAGVSYPSTLNNISRKPMRGKSLMNAILQPEQAVHDSTAVFIFEHAQRIFVRKGDWKLVNINPPFKEENFVLYNLSTDLAEQHDLRSSEPEKYEELLSEWRKFAQEVKVQIPPPVNY